MASDLTPAEARFVRALCTGGPLGIAALGLSRALGVTTTTIANLSLIVERKGFCIRERFGMRVFLRPTSAALAFAASPVAETSLEALDCPAQLSPPKPRSPRISRLR